ncbi:hypothetical protein RQM59_12375 [Flavobacteriaceae bacterium S356]|uniref:Uncharacterized protein n=1 Tax=Asprobacillus argus TaxID=3076534 RepID=A0ABU3LIZ5_9FLAO|nr:hypothetical protein [Flavobacteriaceae bacterium S356]
MKRVLLLLTLALMTIDGFTQEAQSVASLKGTEVKTGIRLQYLTMDMPVDQVSYPLKPTMGMMGLHYLVGLNDWLYAGIGMKAAAIGDQGGLFTLGVDLGVNQQLYKNLYLDANVHFGGGGGFRSLVNGGAIIQPNIGLQYKAKHFSFGAQYSHVNFFTGIMKSDAVSFFIEIPSVLRFANYTDARKDFVTTNLSSDNFWKRPATKNVQQVRFDFLFPIGGSREDAPANNALLRRTLYVIGFEYQKYLNSNLFLYVHTDTVYKGLIAGFMDLYFGAGYNFVDTKYINFFAKTGIGAAGGRIAQEGGITMYPSVGFDIKFTNNIALSLHGGYVRALDGDFEAYSSGFGIKYFGLSGGTKEPITKKSIDKVETKGFRIGVENQSFFRVKRFGAHTVDLQLIAIKPYYDLSDNFYLMGEASFAYEGNSGGYAHGVFGIGAKSNRFLNDKISGVAEFSFGAAGGGRVDTGEGLVVRPTIGLNYHSSDALTFNVSVGQLLSLDGGVSSNNINVGFSYGLSFLNAKK